MSSLEPLPEATVPVVPVPKPLATVRKAGLDGTGADPKKQTLLKAVRNAHSATHKIFGAGYLENEDFEEVVRLCARLQRLHDRLKE